MTVKKNFNVIALRGGRMDDMEYVAEFDLDPELAYTPKINDAMLRKVHSENIEYYMDEGMTFKQAKYKADENMSVARKSIQQLLKKQTM